MTDLLISLNNMLKKRGLGMGPKPYPFRNNNIVDVACIEHCCLCTA